MLSLYLHIPFCEKKCNYCSFQVCPKDLTKPEIWENLLDEYTENLKKEIQFYGEIFTPPTLTLPPSGRGKKEISPLEGEVKRGKQELFTIFFWGGTPWLLWAKRIIILLQEIEKYFSLENFSELNIEINPYPTEDIYTFIDEINSYCKKYSRVRFSFGIQSLDNKILRNNQRESSFTGIVDFLRGLRPHKRDNTFFNLDFIAFGEFNKNQNWELALWSDSAWEFYIDLIESHFIDSFSVYTLELFPWSLSFYEKETPHPKPLPLKWEGLTEGGDREWFDRDELIADEFSLLSNELEEWWYNRYELSNFALPGKSSIHNHVYWNMENYLGLGTSASGFLNHKILEKLSDEKKDKLLKYLGVENPSAQVHWIRRTNTLNIETYSQEEKRVALQETLDERAYLIDEFFLAMRTNNWIQNLEKYTTILVPNYKQILSSLANEDFVHYNEEANTLSLTHEWMNVYNTIITDLVEF